MSGRHKYQSFLDNLHERFPDQYFHTEVRFLEDRQFKFDFALKCCKLAIEVEGGATGGFGHRNIGMFLKDMFKYNSAAILGWKVLRFTPNDLYESKTLDKIGEFLYHNPCPHSERNLNLRSIFLYDA